jgi:hypothetical protein
MVQKDKTAFYILGIVGIVGVVGILVLIAGGSSISNDLSGQALKASTVAKPTKSSTTLENLDSDKDGYPDYYEMLTGTDKNNIFSFTSCYDTDDPEDNSKKGVLYRYVDGNFYSYEDVCVTESVVDTYSCGTVGFLTQTYTCASGKTCVDGACVPKCEDKDGTLEHDARYQVKSYAEKLTKKVSDSCIDNDVISEAVCSDNAPTETRVSCSGLLGAEYFCSNGACTRGS